MPPPPPPLLFDLNLPPPPELDDGDCISACAPHDPAAFPPSLPRECSPEEDVKVEDYGDVCEEYEEEVEEASVEPEQVEGGAGGASVRKRKRKEYEVFVGGLPWEASRRDVEKVFRGFGTVVEVRLVRPRPSEAHKRKPFAFVKFQEVQEARTAAAAVHVVVKDKRCGVSRNNENELLRIENICTSWTKDDLTNSLKDIELKNLEGIYLADNPDRKGRNMGYAFLDFSTRDDAFEAMVKLRKEALYFGVNARPTITFSDYISLEDAVLDEVKSVFVDGLPESWDEDVVREKFKKFGKIEDIELASKMYTSRRKDFCFLTFVTREAALNCIDTVNKEGIVDGDKMVFVRANLKRPRAPPKSSLSKRRHQDLGTRKGHRDSGSFDRRDPHVSHYQDLPSRRHTKDRQLYHSRDYGLSANHKSSLRAGPIHKRHREERQSRDERRNSYERRDFVDESPAFRKRYCGVERTVRYRGSPIESGPSNDYSESGPSNDFGESARAGEFLHESYMDACTDRLGRHNPPSARVYVHELPSNALRYLHVVEAASSTMELEGDEKHPAFYLPAEPFLRQISPIASPSYRTRSSLDVPAFPCRLVSTYKDSTRFTTDESPGYDAGRSRTKIFSNQQYDDALQGSRRVPGA